MDRNHPRHIAARGATAEERAERYGRLVRENMTAERCHDCGVRKDDRSGHPLDHWYRAPGATGPALTRPVRS